MWRRVWASIFWLTPFTNSLKCVNRNSPFPVNTSRISLVHLSATPPLGMSLGERHFAAYGSDTGRGVRCPDAN